MDEVESRVKVDCEATVTFLKKSAIPLKDAEQEVFAASAVGAGDVVKYSYGPFVYSNIGERKKLKKMYGEGVMEVNAEKFSKLSFKLPDIIQLKGLLRKLHG